MTKIEVTWVEHTTYTKVFELPEITGGDGEIFSYEDATLDEIEEIMDEDSLWDQVSETEWAGGNVTLRETVEARISNDES